MPRKQKGRKRKSVRKMLTFTGFTARVMMSVMAALLLLSFLALVANPARVWFFTLFGLLFIPLLIVNFLLLLWALKRRSKTFVIPLVAILPSFFFIGDYFRVSGTPDLQPSRDSSLKIVSYNIGRFRQGSKAFKDRDLCVDSLFAFLNRQDADVICLQEFYIKDLNRLKPFLSKHLKGYKAEYFLFDSRYGNFGNITLSKLPVIGKGVIRFDGSANLSLYTDHRYKDRKIRIYNCHFESYNISLTGLLRSVLNRNKDEIMVVEKKMESGIKRRPRQVQQVLEHIATSPVEAIVCGDFNDNPMSYTYTKLMKGRKDTFREAGRGFSATYKPLWPFVRIDYILCPDEMAPCLHTTPRVPFSDHYPVVATIGW